MTAATLCFLALLSSAASVSPAALLPFAGEGPAPLNSDLHVEMALPAAGVGLGVDFTPFADCSAVALHVALALSVMAATNSLSSPYQSPTNASLLVFPPEVEVVGDVLMPSSLVTSATGALGGAPTLAALFTDVYDNLRQAVRYTSVLLRDNSVRLQFAKLGSVRGARVLCHVSDAAVGTALQHFGEWESLQTQRLELLLEPGDVALDVGAHVGTHTVAMAHAVYPLGVVHAFEPQEELFKLLTANARMAGTNNIVAHLAAVGAVADTVAVPVLNTTVDDVESLVTGVNLGALSLVGCARGGGSVEEGATLDDGVPVEGATGNERRENVDVVSCASDGPRRWVRTVALDDMGLHGVDFIKLDVEHMEVDVLAGMGRILEHSRPVLHLENGGVDNSAALVAHLHGLNYAMWWEVGRFVDQDNYFGDVLQHDTSEMLWASSFSTNLIAVPREKPMTPRILAALHGLAPVDPAKPALHMYNVTTLARLPPLLKLRPEGNITRVQLVDNIIAYEGVVRQR